MSDALMRTKLEKSMNIKSLTDLVRVRSTETAFLLIDVSGSMKETMRNGKERITALREVVADIQKNSPTKMIAFGGHDGGAYMTATVPNAGGGTPLAEAIRLAKTQNIGRAVVISDGMPNNAQDAMTAAKEFGGRIDVVFVGDPGEPGEAFLKELAEMTGGTEFHGDLSQPKELGAKISGLLGSGDDDDDDEDEKGAIQL